MKKYSRSTIKYYDEIADDYAESGAAVVLEDKIGQFIKLLSGKRVLDVACGPGHDVYYLRRQGIDCLGVDLSGRMIEIAKKAYGNNFKVMDALNLHLKKDFFDGVWCSSIFVHIEKNDLPRLMANLKKVLKEDGVIGIITAHKRKRIREKEDTRTYTMFGKKELEECFLRNNFQLLISEIFVYGGRRRVFIIARKK